MSITNHKCFISFKMEDEGYKNEIIDDLGDQMIDKSLHESIDSDDPDYVMRKIREDYLSDSTVTIFIIGMKSNENLGYSEQQYIKRELQASLYNGDGNSRNGILGVVLPSMTAAIYRGKYTCGTCGKEHDYVAINDATVIKEFSKNYYIDSPSAGCCWGEDDRYCVLVKWADFKATPQNYINQAFDKRTAPIAWKVTVYPR